ncbi:MAG: NUDIX hydrolase [Gemmatimonadaceae bacterium]
MPGPRPSGARRRDRTTEEVSAGGIVVRRATDGPFFLVIRDSYRNWGFPKGHLESGESASDAALREVSEETGLEGLRLVSAIDTIDWYFRFRGRLVHKVCHFYLLETDSDRTTPQRDEGITACRWETYDRAAELVSYENARGVLRRAFEILSFGAPLA